MNKNTIKTLIAAFILALILFSCDTVKHSGYDRHAYKKAGSGCPANYVR